MSRVGKYPVIVPEGVNITVEAENILVKGKNGELSCHYNPEQVSVTMDGNKVVVAPKGETKLARALWGTTRANINTLVKGVNEGFYKNLELVGVGYKARMEGTKLVLSLGFSHDVNFPAPEGIKISCETPTQIKVFGVDKQLVGQVAAQIRKYRKPEPYKGKGVKLEGEYVRRKEGKKK